MATQYLNTLYVTTQGSYLHKSGENIVIKINDEETKRIPIHTLQGIVCFGRVTLSFPLMGFCMEKNIQISFLSQYGKFLGRVTGKVSGNVLLRRQQYRLADETVKKTSIVANIVTGKILNQRAVLRRYIRDHQDTTKELDISRLKSTVRHFTDLTSTIQKTKTIDQIRGFEGEAASAYFGNFNTLITNSDFVFETRTRRPPLDKINAMLSFVYTILVHDISSGLETTGLDPAVGFLHTDRPGRPSLSLDIMEEFRPWFADRLVLSLINKSQVSPEDFETMHSGACLITEKARRKILVFYQKRKQVTINHQFLNQTVPIGMICHLQSRLLARHIRGDINEYLPFIWK